MEELLNTLHNIGLFQDVDIATFEKAFNKMAGQRYMEMMTAPQINQELSDEIMKHIEGKMQEDAGQQMFEDNVVDAYAENAKNYAYTYKPEATQIDPEIDPNEEHIGIMAQDIEKINPACIKETPEGVKTVDTGRLTLMNAGAIGDIARRLKALEGAVNGR